jgi:hypothetical protein
LFIALCIRSGCGIYSGKIGEAAGYSNLKFDGQQLFLCAVATVQLGGWPHRRLHFSFSLVPIDRWKDVAEMGENFGFAALLYLTGKR